MNEIATVAQEELVQRQLTRQSLLAFTARFTPDYSASWAHKLIGNRLEHVYEATRGGHHPRVMLACPPRMGKSRLASQMFPAWVLGHWPEAEFMIASYSSALTVNFSRTVRSILEDPMYKAVFPDTSIDPESRSVENWYTTQAGRYYPTSVGGSLTGMGCNFLICDDLVKDQEVADSETQLDKIYDWYTSTALTRLAPQSSVVHIATRWSDQDPQGRLLQHQQDMEKQLKQELAHARDEAFKVHLTKELDALEKWEVISFPALAERDEYITPEHGISHTPQPGFIHVRDKHEALHPERFDAAVLRRIQKALPRRQWNALYQQNPVPEEGSFFKKSGMHYHEVRPSPDFPVLQAWDFAIGTKQDNDWTVGVTGFLDYEGMLHITDLVRIKGDALDIVNAIVAQARKHTPAVIGMERGHISMSIIPTLEKEMVKNRIFCTINADLVPVNDKSVRARPLQGMFQRHMISINPRQSWYEDLMRELLRFPHGVNDDQVDAFSWLAKMSLAHSLPQKSRQAVGKSWKDSLHKLVSSTQSHLQA